MRGGNDENNEHTGRLTGNNKTGLSCVNKVCACTYACWKQLTVSLLAGWMRGSSNDTVTVYSEYILHDLLFYYIFSHVILVHLIKVS